MGNAASANGARYSPGCARRSPSKAELEERVILREVYGELLLNGENSISLADLAAQLSNTIPKLRHQRRLTHCHCQAFDCFLKYIDHEIVTELCNIRGGQMLHKLSFEDFVKLWKNAMSTNLTQTSRGNSLESVSRSATFNGVSVTG
mmetsp:Transcript_20205/g.22861  ORF Transcript_20205/g.22861 Transcript_20205/m.22861 type:complete len:147 (+) Transcript_20205:356-796(+)